MTTPIIWRKSRRSGSNPFGNCVECAITAAAGTPGPVTYTHPDVLTIGVAEGWADPETDPTRIDWAPRQAAAAIPFEVVDGRPVNPFGPTGIRHGRNQLGHWGEALAADALVLATTPAGERYALMIERDDEHGWALPGGHVDSGETARHAGVRELQEETGLDLFPRWWDWQESEPRYVPDLRASDEAWMVTTLLTIDLGTMYAFPAVDGSDDAARAAWVRADSFDTLTADLAETYQGAVFAAHAEMLRAALDGPRPVHGKCGH